jgi:hypothetical protein
MGNNDSGGTTVGAQKDSAMKIGGVWGFSRFVGWGSVKQHAKSLKQVATERVQPKETDTNYRREIPVRRNR